MITRRTLLTGAAAAVAVSVAASAVTRENKKRRPIPYSLWQPVSGGACGFGLAQLKREGESVEYDPCGHPDE